MDRVRAARLLTKWIQFTGMDNPDGWEVPPGEEPAWPFVQNTKRAFEYAICLLEGKDVEDADRDQAIYLISNWPKYNGMDNPDAWDKDDYPFVANCRKAIDFTVDFLKNHRE